MKETSASPRALTSEEYDRLWPDWPDLIRYHPGHRHRRRKMLQWLKPLKNARSVLDVGCGSGETLQVLATQCPQFEELWGVDISPEICQENQARFQGMNFRPLNVENAALPRSFDVIVCTEVIEHLNDRRLAMKHMTEMLAPGGHLFITTPAGKVYATERHFGHTTHPSPEEIQSLADENGLKVIKLENWGWPTYKLLKEATNFNADWALKNFASGRYSLSKRLIAHTLYGLNFLNSNYSKNGCQIFALLQKP